MKISKQAYKEIEKLANAEKADSCRVQQRIQELLPQLEVERAVEAERDKVQQILNSVVGVKDPEKNLDATAYYFYTALKDIKKVITPTKTDNQ